MCGSLNDCCVYLTTQGHGVHTEGHKQTDSNNIADANCAEANRRDAIKWKIRNVCCKKELGEELGRAELQTLDLAGFPQPLTEEHLSDLIKKIHVDLNEENVVCAVCDEICLISKTKLLDAKSLPASFFNELRTPTDVEGAQFILPDELVKQYDLSGYFPGDDRFKNLLLSPRGMKTPNCECPLKNNSCCVYQLYICETTGCFQALRKGKIPKYAVAQGNWIGQLPEDLRNMTYGTRCLIRPMQSFGRLAAFYNGGGMRLTGHVYSNKLNAPLVRKKLPINPSEVPVRVLVVSPLATDASVLSRARMASIKEDYVIEPEKIRATLDFFKNNGNKVMDSIEYDEHELHQLPKGEVSVKMFHVDDSTSLCEIEESITLNDKEMQTENSNDNANDITSFYEREDSRNIDESEMRTEVGNEKTGGPCLLRSHTEAEDAVLISSTVTVGATEACDENVHEQVVRALNDGVNERNRGMVG